MSADYSWGIVCIYCDKPMTNAEADAFGDSCESWHAKCAPKLVSKVPEMERKLREILRDWKTSGEWFHIQLYLASEMERLGEEEFKRIAREEGVPEEELV